jgi:hypothetical protein
VKKESISKDQIDLLLLAFGPLEVEVNSRFRTLSVGSSFEYLPQKYSTISEVTFANKVAI